MVEKSSWMKRTRSLALVVSCWLALAIAASMGIYAVFQYYSVPGMTVKELFLHHLWHVLSLGALIYVLCWALLQRVLLQPLSKIYLHLYSAGKGKAHLLELDTRITELRTIVDGINLMLRLQSPEYATQGRVLAKHSILQIKTLAHALPPSAGDIATQLLSCVTDLEKALAAGPTGSGESSAVNKV